MQNPVRQSLKILFFFLLLIWDIGRENTNIDKHNNKYIQYVYTSMKGCCAISRMKSFYCCAE